MKKILLLLLLSIAGYGQTSTGQEQSFPYGIVNESLQTITTPTYIGTFGTDGTQGKIPSAYIAKTAAVQDSLNKKLNLPTGFLQGLALSINADPTKFNIAAGYYVVTDFTNLTQPVVKIINYAGATGLTPAYLATANSTYVALDINGAVVSSASPFTDAQRRTLAIIGNVVHSNHTTINVVNEIKAPIVAVGNQLHDFMKAIGFLNESGNVYSANGSNLQINKSVGDIFGMGINASDYLSPHKLTIPSQTALTFAYRFQNGTQLEDTQNINPNIYDVGGTSTATPSNKWTIQRINLFQSGLSRIQPGQNVYNSFNDAVVALPTQSFVTEQNIADNAVFRCYLIVQQGTTNLASAVAGGAAQFVPVDKFGNIIGNGSVALTYSNIVAALGFTPENVANKSDSYTASSSTTYASTKAIVDGLATKQNTLTNPITGTGTTNTIAKWTGTTTQGNSSITDNGSLVTITNPTTFIGLNTIQGTAASDGGQLGSELTTTATGTNWTGTGFATGYTHTIGSTVALVSTLAAVANNLYQITWTITGRTTGSVTINYGGIAIGGITASGNSGPKATSTATLNIVPTTDFNGTVVLSIKVISPSVATTTFKNSIGEISNEIRTNGTTNVFIGNAAGKYNYTIGAKGIYNTFIGANCGESNTTGRFNTFVGNNSGAKITVSEANSSFGSGAFSNNIEGYYNSAFGTGALANFLGSSNSAFGYNSLANNISGSSNIAVGYQAGFYISNKSTTATSISNSVMLGHNTSPLADSQTNQIVIGHNANGLGSNSTVIGNSSTTTARVYGRQLVNTSTDNGTDQLQVNGTISATAASTANQVVVKSQLDGKVSLTGNETVTGNKTLSGTTTLNETIIREGYQLKFPKGVMYQSSVGTNALTDNRTVSFPDASGTVALVETVRPYKVYTALLSQSGTSAPTATVLENTLGGTVVWTRSSTGLYNGTLTGIFTASKTVFFINQGNGASRLSGYRPDTNTVQVVSMNAYLNEFADNSINNASIEIRVYN